MAPNLLQYVLLAGPQVHPLELPLAAMVLTDGRLAEACAGKRRAARRASRTVSLAMLLVQYVMMNVVYVNWD